MLRDARSIFYESVHRKPREKAFQVIVFINQSGQEVDNFRLLVALSNFVTRD